MARGGKRPGAGRPKGAISKMAQEAREKASEQGITPLDYMLHLLRDEELDADTRFEAAKAAAPYLHPKLSSVEMNANVSVSHEDALEQLE